MRYFFGTGAPCPGEEAFPRFVADLRKACPQARVLDALVLRGSNQIERRLKLGLTLRHTEDDVVRWLNRIFAEAKTP